MTDNVDHLLVGYDPVTEYVVYEATIPPRDVIWVLDQVRPDEDDPRGLDSYPISDAIANAIIGYSQLPRRMPGIEYFVESRAAR